MKLRRQSGRGIFTLALVAVVLLGGVTRARGQAYRVIYEFGHSYSDGWFPVGVPAVAKNGDLYGVTMYGGAYNLGTAFKLMVPPTRVGVWKKTVLYDFPGGKGGGGPHSLMFGGDGNLYGNDNGQSIFELSAPKSGDGVWKYHLLYALNGTTEGEGIEGIVLDAEGNIYGATEEGGGVCGCGTVFALKRPTQQGGKWRFRVLYTFDGSGNNGAEPFAGVTFDQKGNLYGTTNYGGTFGYGVAYRLAPPAKKGQSWIETVLYSFNPSNNIGSSPEGPVIFDGSGNMYGTTAFGGDLNCAGGFGCGVVYELSPPTQKGRDWTYTTLYAFTGGNDGAIGGSALLFDSEGNLYGTTTEGYTFAGTAFRLSPPANGGGPWTETTLHGFTGKNGDGAVPNGLTWGKWGNLYGVTGEGGSGCQRLGCGTVFEVRP